MEKQTRRKVTRYDIKVGILDFRRQMTGGLKKKHDVSGKVQYVNVFKKEVKLKRQRLEEP